jgi:CRISPR system Cascade subunit CasA
MNMVDDAWVPAMNSEDGVAKHVSLLDAFQNAQEIRDLAVNPVQRIALMRLLICIAQAALDGPEDEDDWLDCRERISDEATAYLKQWRGSFELYGNRPFLQIPDLDVKEGKSKPLDFLTSPNNTSLFHHSLGTIQQFSDAEIALSLLCFQNFSTGGKVGQSIWRGEQLGHSTFAAPCLNYLHLFVLGDTLLDTIWLNLLSKYGTYTGVDKTPNCTWGRPSWDWMPREPSDAGAFENSCWTYLGRMVPLARLVKLREDDCIAGPIPKKYVMEHLPQFRESTGAVVRPTKDNEDPQYFRVRHDAHMWRELHALLAWRADDFSRVSGPAALYRLVQLLDAGESGNGAIWVGGLQIGENAGKLRDMAEWRFEFPLRFLDEQLRSDYAKGVDMCDTACKRALSHAVNEYASRFDQTGAGGAIKRDTQFKAGLKRRFENTFWTELDGVSPELERIATDETKDLTSDWIPLVKQAAINAYEASCPHTTPRQIMAYSAGLKRLRWQLKKLDNSEEG